MPRHSFAGGAVETTLTSSCLSTDMTLNVAGTSGWPNTTIGPFVITVDRGKTTEEKCLCSAYTGTTVTVLTRGYDGTTAVGHGNGATVEHTLDATQVDAHDGFVFGVGTVVPSTSAPGDAAAAGTSTLPAAGDHRHGREAFGASAGTSAVGDTAAAGTATTPSRSDHRHGRESFAVGATTTSNPGDGAADGTSTSPARADHRHGREAQALPAGSLLAGAWSAAPSGYLLCDGTAVSRSIYSALFAAIGVAWGAGDGSTTFNVPDLRGRTAVGANGPGGAGQPNWPLGTMSGSTSITEANMPAHNHTGTTGVDAPNHSHAAPGGGSGYIVNVSSTVGLQPGGSNPAANSGGPTAGVSNNHYHSIPTDGSGTAYSQPFAAVLYVIKT